MTERQPIRVGIVGLSPCGRFLLERLALHTDYELSMFQAENVPTDNLVRSLQISTHTNWHRFLSQPGLKAVLFFDGPSLELIQVQAVIDAGLHAGILPPLLGELAEWDAFADQTQGRVQILNPHREVEDFQAAKLWTQLKEAKPLTAIKLVSWVPNLVDSHPNRSSSEGLFRQRLWEDLDQLLSLTDESPTSVFAANFSPQRQTYFVVLKFEDGAIAHLEHRQGSVVSIDQGWTLMGENSGYANGRRHIQTEEGEVYDVPFELSAATGESSLDPIRKLFDSSPLDQTLKQAMQILKIQLAIQESFRIGEVVTVEWD